MPPRRKIPAKKTKAAVEDAADATSTTVTDSHETAVKQEEDETINLQDEETSLEQIETAISTVLDDSTGTDNDMHASDNEAVDNEAADNIIDITDDVIEITDDVAETTDDVTKKTDNGTKTTGTDKTDQVKAEASSTDEKKPLKKANLYRRNDDLKSFRTSCRMVGNQKRIALFPLTLKQLCTITEIHDILTQKTVRYQFNVYDATQGVGLLEMLFGSYKDALAAESVLYTLRSDENTFTVQHNKIGLQKYNSLEEVSILFPHHINKPGKEEYLESDFGKQVAYVFNLPASCDEDRLKEQFPEAINIWLPRDPFGNSKCEAYLSLKDADDLKEFMKKYAKKTVIDDHIVPVFRLKLPAEVRVGSDNTVRKRFNSESQNQAAQIKKPKINSYSPAQGGKQLGRFAGSSQTQGGSGGRSGGRDQGKDRFGGKGQGHHGGQGGRDGSARSGYHGRRDSGGRQNKRWDTQQSSYDDWGNTGYSQQSRNQGYYAPATPQPLVPAQPSMGSMQTQDALSLLVGLSQLVSGNKSGTGNVFSGSQSGGGGGGFGSNNPAISSQNFRQSSQSDFRSDRNYQGGYNDASDQTYQGGYNDDRGKRNHGGVFDYGHSKKYY